LPPTAWVHHAAAGAPGEASYSGSVPAHAPLDGSRDDMTELPLLQADYDGYPKAIAGLQTRFTDLPRSVSIETQVHCNAKCSFCPYPGSPRQGQEMSTELVHKLIDELSEMPPEHRFQITLHRLNEPMLDPRLRGFAERIGAKLPGAKQHFITNGSLLRERNIDWMSQFPTASLTVSVNSLNEEEHVRLMGFGLKAVVRGLDELHESKAQGRFDLPVRLTAQFRSPDEGRAYEQECRARWPLFEPGVRPFFEWMGGSHAGKEYRVNFGLPVRTTDRIAGFACGQWFDLHVLASGFVARCCIDETGLDGDAFDVRHHHVLDVYRQSRSLRSGLPGRSEVAGCNGCMHLG